jgi:hypothetical protein
VREFQRLGFGGRSVVVVASLLAALKPYYSELLERVGCGFHTLRVRAERLRENLDSGCALLLRAGDAMGELRRVALDIVWDTQRNARTVVMPSIM